MKNLALIFPGIGYSVDKPLLYWTKKILVQKGFDVIDIKYGKLPDDAKKEALKSNCKFDEIFDISLKNALSQICEIDFDDYENIFFISKSIGSSIAAKISFDLIERNAHIKNVIFTPVEKTFEFMNEFISENAICFHGTNDPWIESDKCVELCSKHGIELVIIQNANHSLEINDAMNDIQSCHYVIEKVFEFINN